MSIAAESPAAPGPQVRTRSVRRLRRPPTWLFALLAYTAISMVTIGWYAIPHLSRTCACVGTQDPSAYMWDLAWWPHAIAHGLNPFFTHLLWAPTGVNVASAATIPTAAFVMTPVTALFGPLVSYNVLSIASPALTAFTAYLLCRRLVGRELPALAGGYLFGFSSFELAQLTGHLNLTLLFLVPLAVHLALLRCERDISRRVYVCAIAAVFVAQAGLSTEILATGVMVGAVALLAARLLTAAPYRERITGLIAETVGGGLIAIVVSSPFLYYALFSGKVTPAPPPTTDLYGLDLLNPFFPTLITYFGHHDFMALGLSFEGGNISESAGYLSIPLIAAFGVWVVTTRRRTLAKMLLTVVAVSVLGALGSHLHIAGMSTVELPFNWVRNAPVFDNIVPSRIILYAALAIAIGMAAWLAEGSGRAVIRWLVFALCVAMLFPDISVGVWGRAPDNPAFFRTAMYKRYLIPHETVLALPYGQWDNSMLWQAETGLAFYMPEGYVSGVVPAPFISDPVAAALGANAAPPAAAFGSFIRDHSVRDVVIDQANPGPYPALMAQLGLHGRTVGGVIVYRIPNAPQ